MTKLEKIIYDAIIKEHTSLSGPWGLDCAKSVTSAVLPLIGSAFDAGMRRATTKNKYKWLYENVTGKIDKKETE